jgi:hypothetical protein
MYFFKTHDLLWSKIKMHCFAWFSDGKVSAFMFLNSARDAGYDRIVGALDDPGYRVSDRTVGNFLKRHGIDTERGRHI